jgi:hypothetical protein
MNAEREAAATERDCAQSQSQHGGKSNALRLIFDTAALQVRRHGRMGIVTLSKSLPRLCDTRAA